MDVRELLADGEYRLVLNLIHHLPQNTYTREAISQDETITRMMLANSSEDKKKSAAPRLSTFSPEVQILADLVDTVASVRAAVIASQGGKPGKAKPYPRPETARDRVKSSMRREDHERLRARVLPHVYGPGADESR